MLKESIHRNAVFLNVSVGMAMSGGSGSPRSEFTAALGAGAFVGGASCLVKELVVRRFYRTGMQVTNENVFEDTVKWATIGSGFGGFGAIIKHLIEDLSS